MIENTRPVLVRMPPSPTGALHLGTARTALFNWLFAHGNDEGDIIFRWEDTDRERSKAEHETAILDGLAWLGMDFMATKKTFFRQTECTAMHEKYLQQLWTDGQVFPCFVTTDELDQQRTRAREKKQNFVFWSPSRDLPRTELETKMESQSYVWRLKTPHNLDVIHNDAIRGQVKTNTETIGDIVVARADGSVLYMLANVVDDWQQGITHVIRGEDHIANTPKQILLYSALNAPLPTFAHIPLVLDRQRRKLSKRRVEPGIAVLIPDFQMQGFLPQAVVNGLAFTGWHPGGEAEEILSMKELMEQFGLSGVQKSAAQYDFEKMRWFNREWLKKLPLQEVVIAYKTWANAYAEGKFTEHPDLEKAIALVRQKAYTLAQMPAEMAYILEDPGFGVSNLKDPAAAKDVLGHIKEMLEATPEADFTPEKLREIAIAKIKEIESKTKFFLPPWRIALSNQTPSAGPFEVAPVLGKVETLRRIEHAIATL